MANGLAHYVNVRIKDITPKGSRVYFQFSLPARWHTNQGSILSTQITYLYRHDSY
jgi:hypothetical protein